MILTFARLTYRESLWDIETCLRALGTKLYHSGIRSHTSRSTSTLADANEKRDWRIFCDFAHVLIAQTTNLHAAEDFGAELKEAYALDSTTIDLCLSLFPWATFRRAKAAVKLHTLLALRGFPSVVIVTPGSVHGVNILDDRCFDPGSFYIMDKAYLDYARLHRLHRCGAFFVTRAKQNARFKRRYSRQADKTAGVRFDQTVTLSGFTSHRHYPAPRRRIVYRNPATGKNFVFITNNFLLPSLTIARLYKSRWQVELFFKWIKQHLRIKAFYGTSENTVRVQVWEAIAIYVLIAAFRK